MVKVGIDMDECLCTGVAEHLVNELNKIMGTDYNISNLRTYSLENEMGASRDYMDDILLKIDYKSLGIMPEADDYIQDMAFKDGKEIYIVTSRNPKIPGIMQSTYDWLDNNNIPFNDLCFSTKKGKVAQALHLDYFVEDAPHYATDIAKKGVRVLLMNHPWNRDLNIDNMIRVYGWEDIYDRMIK